MNVGNLCVELAARNIRVTVTVYWLARTWMPEMVVCTYVVSRLIFNSQAYGLHASPIRGIYRVILTSCPNRVVSDDTW